MQARLGWAGVDEAGRGPLAGPVVAAAVLLPDSFDGKGIRDSKIMSPAERDDAEKIIKDASCFCIGVADVGEIDRLNILQAALLAMRRAFEGLEELPKGALIDGNRPVPGLPVPYECVVKGDGIYTQIAAASILAKTYRDRLMRNLSSRFPQYGFDRHFGYATQEHLRAILYAGPCEAHRRSFRPVKDMLQQRCLEVAD